MGTVLPTRAPQSPCLGYTAPSAPTGKNRVNATCSQAQSAGGALVPGLLCRDGSLGCTLRGPPRSTLLVLLCMTHRARLGLPARTRALLRVHGDTVTIQALRPPAAPRASCSCFQDSALSQL